MPATRESSGTNLFYGNLMFTNVVTRDFTQTIEMDQSDSSVLFSRIRITIEGSIDDGQPPFTIYPSGVAIGPSIISDYGDRLVGSIKGSEFMNLTSSEKIVYIKQELEQARLRFRYEVNGIPLIAAKQYSDNVYQGSIDINNGPKCRSFNITSVIGGKTYRYTATFEACILPCDLYIQGDPLSIAADPAEPGTAEDLKQVVTYARWSVSQMRNADFSITRIINGRVRVATWEAWARYEFAIKNLVIPPLLDGYQRRSVSTVISENQLDMLYQVVDQQREAAPPFPVVDWAGQWSESTGDPGEDAKPASVGRLSVSVLGAPGTPKRYLWDAAMAIVDSKLNLENLQTIREGSKGLPMITASEVVDMLASNEIHVTIHYVRSFVADGWATYWVNKLDVLPSVNYLLGETTEWRTGDDKYNRDTWPIPWSADPDVPAGWLQNALSAMCKSEPPSWRAQEAPNAGSDTPDGRNDENKPQKNSRGTSQENFGAIESREIPGSRGKPDDGTLPYTWIELDSRYNIDNGWTAMPVGSVTGRVGADSAILCQLHAPISTWTVYYRAERVGLPPQIPSYRQTFRDENGISFAMVESEILPQSPLHSPDGVNLRYRLECRYTYAMSRFFTKDEELASGELPWLALENSETAFKLSDDNQSDMKLFKTSEGSEEGSGEGGTTEPAPQTPKPPPPGS